MCEKVVKGVMCFWRVHYRRLLMYVCKFLLVPLSVRMQQAENLRIYFWEIHIRKFYRTLFRKFPVDTA